MPPQEWPRGDAKVDEVSHADPPPRPPWPSLLQVPPPSRHAGFFLQVGVRRWRSAIGIDYSLTWPFTCAYTPFLFRVGNDVRPCHQRVRQLAIVEKILCHRHPRRFLPILWLHGAVHGPECTSVDTGTGYGKYSMRYAVLTIQAQVHALLLGTSFDDDDHIPAWQGGQPVSPKCLKPFPPLFAESFFP